MKTQNVVDSCLVDEIFYKINEIYMHHATFIAFLARAMHDPSTTIGDVINKNVSSPLGSQLTGSLGFSHSTWVFLLFAEEIWADFQKSNGNTAGNSYDPP